MCKEEVNKTEKILEIKTIKRLNDFLEILKNLKDKNKESKIFYRGQSNEKWGLLPSIARDGYQTAELQMIKEVTLSKPDDFIGLNHFNILAKLQHYGMPTRLLDVTENPLIALYFSCIGNYEENGSLFFLVKDYCEIYDSNNIIVNLISSMAITSGQWTGGFEFESFIEGLHFVKPELADKVIKLIEFTGVNGIDAIYKKIQYGNKLVVPEKSNERISKQNGAFILFSNDTESKSETNHLSTLSKKHWFYNSFTDIKDIVLKDMGISILIDKSSKIDIIKELDDIGINESSLFPELQDVCKFVKVKWYGYKNNLIL